VTELIVKDNAVVGCKYEKEGKIYEEYGPVVIATGGFGADYGVCVCCCVCVCVCALWRIRVKCCACPVILRVLLVI